MAKKLIAIVMALALVLSFAACGGKGDDTTTAPETTTDPFDAFGEETTAAPAEDPSATLPPPLQTTRPQPPLPLPPQQQTTLPPLPQLRLPRLRKRSLLTSTPLSTQPKRAQRASLPIIWSTLLRVKSLVYPQLLTLSVRSS